MKDIKSLLLVLLSVGLISTWFYHLYDKTQYANQRKEIFIKDSIAVAEAVQDSLHKIYTASITNLDQQLNSTKTDADSLRVVLKNKLTEINKLRSEINSILQNKGASKSDMSLAKSKIATLQVLVDELKGQNANMEDEKKRLTDVMTQLNGEIADLQNNMKKIGEENKILTEKVNLASTFVSSSIKLIPVAVKNDKEQETSLARKTSKLVVEFSVQNNLNDYSNAEVYIILTQPDGNVLMPDVWDAATPMVTQGGGKKNYTRRIRFEYQKGEIKTLTFSLNADEYQKGKYSLQLYHNGFMIGQTTSLLN